MNKKRKQKKPSKLNMSFEEALKRFTSVSKKEIKEAIDKEKAEKEKRT